MVPQSIQDLHAIVYYPLNPLDTAGHKRTHQWHRVHARACKVRALEHATVPWRTVATSNQGRPTALGFPLVSPEEASTSATCRAVGPLLSPPLSPLPARAPADPELQ